MPVIAPAQGPDEAAEVLRVARVFRIHQPLRNAGFLLPSHLPIPPGHIRGDTFYARVSDRIRLRSPMRRHPQHQGLPPFPRGLQDLVNQLLLVVARRPD